MADNIICPVVTLKAVNNSQVKLGEIISLSDVFCEPFLVGAE